MDLFAVHTMEENDYWCKKNHIPTYLVNRIQNLPMFTLYTKYRCLKVFFLISNRRFFLIGMFSINSTNWSFQIIMSRGFFSFWYPGYSVWKNDFFQKTWSRGWWIPFWNIWKLPYNPFELLRSQWIFYETNFLKNNMNLWIITVF